MFEDFIEYIKKHGKLKSVEDLDPELLYEWQHSPNGIDYGNHILRIIPPDFELIGVDTARFDCMLNLEFRTFNTDDTYVKIYYHNKGFPLSEGWIM
jgi:hypothetical protein